MIGKKKPQKPIIPKPTKNKKTNKQQNKIQTTKESIAFWTKRQHTRSIPTSIVENKKPKNTTKN